MLLSETSKLHRVRYVEIPKRVKEDSEETGTWKFSSCVVKEEDPGFPCGTVQYDGVECTNTGPHQSSQVKRKHGKGGFLKLKKVKAECV